jgi:hypothetical protein
MSQESVEIVERAIAAVNERDIDSYLACCTEDVQLQTPTSPVEGVYEGRDAIRRFFADVSATSADFTLSIERLEPIGANRVVASLRITATGRASGIPTAANTPATNIYDLVDGRLSRVRIFLDRREALEAAEVAE